MANHVEGAADMHQEGEHRGTKKEEKDNARASLQRQEEGVDEKMRSAKAKDVAFEEEDEEEAPRPGQTEKNDEDMSQESKDDTTTKRTKQAERKGIVLQGIRTVLGMREIPINILPTITKVSANTNLAQVTRMTAHIEEQWVLEL